MVVREAAFDSLNLVSGCEEDKKRVDRHQAMPILSPWLEEKGNKERGPSAEVSPCPIFFFLL